MHKADQSLLRKMIIEDVQHMWDNLPVINPYDEIFDEGVTKGFVNWQIIHKSPIMKHINYHIYLI